MVKILLVDDDVLYRELIRTSLAKEGYDIRVAPDGMEAISLAEKDNFDLLITDLFMPNKEGLELIQEIRETQPSIKIIAISSNGPAGFTSFLKIAHALGADETLQKPFKPAQLHEKVYEVLGKQPEALAGQT